jgi:hypothetical protein
MNLTYPLQHDLSPETKMLNLINIQLEDSLFDHLLIQLNNKLYNRLHRNIFTEVQTHLFMVKSILISSHIYEPVKFNKI